MNVTSIRGISPRDMDVMKEAMTFLVICVVSNMAFCCLSR